MKIIDAVLNDSKQSWNLICS